MILKYLQENRLFELVGGSSKSKVSPSEDRVVVVVAAVRLELRYPSFQSNFKPFSRHGGFPPETSSQTAHHARFLEGHPRE